MHIVLPLLAGIIHSRHQLLSVLAAVHGFVDGRLVGFTTTASAGPTNQLAPSKRYVVVHRDLHRISGKLPAGSGSRHWFAPLALQSP